MLKIGFVRDRFSHLCFVQCQRPIRYLDLFLVFFGKSEKFNFTFTLLIRPADKPLGIHEIERLLASEQFSSKDFKLSLLQLLPGRKANIHTLSKPNANPTTNPTSVQNLSPKIPSLDARRKNTLQHPCDTRIAHVSKREQKQYAMQSAKFSRNKA